MDIESILEKKREILVGSASVIAGIAILLGYYQSDPDAVTFARAEMAYKRWDAAPQDNELYRSMRVAMAKVPALEKRYEASIAQALLNGEKTDEALVLARRSLERVKNDTPYHTQYAETSLLIEEGYYREALEKAVALKEQMSHAFDLDHAPRLAGGSVLYAHNLLRIAFLQQELRDRSGEKAAWEELEGFLEAKRPLSHIVQSNFSEKELDLSHYISERKKHL